MKPIDRTFFDKAKTGKYADNYYDAITIANYTLRLSIYILHFYLFPHHNYQGFIKNLDPLLLLLFHTE